jgi:hypothetical protein
LAAWWSGTQGKSARELADEAVLSQFMVVSGARVLHSRLLLLDGDAKSSLTMAIENFDMVKKAIETAPAAMATELVPSLLIAAETVANLSRSEKLSIDEKEIALAALQIRIPALIANKLSRKHLRVDVAEFYDKLVKSDMATLLGEAVDPLADGNEVIEASKPVVAGLSTTLSQELAQDCFNAMYPLFSDISSAEDLDAVLKKEDGRSVANWGINVFEVSFAEWKVADMNAKAKKAKNPVAETVSTRMILKAIPAYDSALMAQVRLDASRVRVALEAIKAKTGSYPTDVKVLNGMFGRRWGLYDPLTQKPYVIDLKAGTLKSTQKPVDRRLIFCNQVIESGAKF